VGAAGRRAATRNGVAPTVALVGEARRRSWAALAQVAVGGVLVGWIALQLLVIG
jgi:hypothetical protein